MSLLSKWKRVKKSGAFRRKTKKIYENLLRDNISINNTNSAKNDSQEVTALQTDSAIVSKEEKNRKDFDTSEKQEDDEDVIKRDEWLIELQNNNEDDSVVSEIEKNAEFTKDLRMWAVKFNISHSALRNLIKSVNKRLPDILPEDPRTLLKTCQAVIMTKVGSGDYWHHGFEVCLRQVLSPMLNLPKSISVNINVDGLPIYKSNKMEFWPILFNIYELPEVKPMVIGIYCGTGKPSSLTAFLQPFISEAQTIFLEGLLINEVIIDVKLRCFICDSPARAFIKGVMKKCLLGWRDGSFGSYKTKWCARDIDTVSKFLEKCKMPREFHRSVRGLDVLCHWKGTEYRTFLYYLGIVILKDVLAPEIYLHFLLFFCGVTICSSNSYKHFLDLAETLLNNYVEYYRDFYGEDYITSNVHNLTHLVEEVRKFGTLSTFNAYPFENKLYQIKQLLRNGNLPLVQVAKRMSEIIKLENDSVKQNNSVCFRSFPILKNKNGIGHFLKIEFDEFSLSSDYPNKWFLTHSNNIVAFHYASLNNDGRPFISGSPVKDIEEVFDIPIKSSYLNIFKSNQVEHTQSNLYSVSEIKSKVVAIEYRETTVFVPLIHNLEK